MGNRIRELRERKGLTGAELAARVGTSQSHIHRLEAGKRRLTVEWMQRISRALGVQPMDLIEVAIAAQHEPDLRPVDPSRAGPFAAALAIKSLKLYEVLTDSMARAGYAEGDVLIVDISVPDWAHVPAAAAVAVTIEADGRSFLCLRHYIPPSMLVSNADDGNSLLDFRIAPVRITLSGVVLQRVAKNNDNGRPIPV